ncbi:hypothetical protein TU79_19465 [Pseudomonas trivialis]|uniref:Uncharacterized protein n=1 Tax=Pseudomonas trivialis TaxID=200450 RepID=A0A0R2ZG06_9PSED|nr:hypothetical protein TU79_19465 [Pseudomonas trivialis]
MFSPFFKANAQWNESAWKNEQFDQLLLLARAETDDARRGTLYADRQTLVHDHCGIGVPVFICERNPERQFGAVQEAVLR